MSRYEFLHPDWIDAALAIRDEYADRVEPTSALVRLNLVITRVPFVDKTIRACIDTSEGSTIPILGHLDPADATIILRHELAKSLLLGRDASAAMTAFLLGQIKVDGDLTKLIALQATSPSPAAKGLATEVRDRVYAITDGF
ncbi:MAG: hypothetical protein ACKVKO_02500 [Acidimicrobiales bacterium]